MTMKSCREFEQWLERLPREDLSPAMERHVMECEYCREQLKLIGPVVSSLKGLSPPHQLNSEVMNRMVIATRREMNHQQGRWMATKLSVVSLLCLPIIIGINWLWVEIGYRLLNEYTSPVLAQIYLILSVSTALTLSGLAYGSIPLLAGWIRKENFKESVV